MGEPDAGARPRGASAAALGVEHVAVVDPMNLQAHRRARCARRSRTTGRASSSRAGRARCSSKSDKQPLRGRARTSAPRAAICIELGCPALSKDGRPARPSSTPPLCVGCAQCAAVCRYGAIGAGAAARARRVSRRERRPRCCSWASAGRGRSSPATCSPRSRRPPGLDVKLSEVHGMSQRGGSVDTIVRFGEKVYSPVVSRGRGRPPRRVRDHRGGALAALPASPAGGCSSTARTIPPLPGAHRRAAGARPASRPRCSPRTPSSSTPRRSRARPARPRSANVVLLGALSVGLPFDEETWRDVIAARVPAKTVEANLRGVRTRPAGMYGRGRSA